MSSVICGGSSNAGDVTVDEALEPNEEELDVDGDRSGVDAFERLGERGASLPRPKKERLAL